MLKRLGGLVRIRGWKQGMLSWAVASTTLCAAALFAAFNPIVGSALAQSMGLSGKFDVTPVGAATYSIPIAVPPGTAGMIPALSLEYNSQSGDGILGLNWSLGGLPAIGHCPRTIAQDGVSGGVNFDANDRFCMDGQRLVVISGTYGADGSEYRTELEGFSRIIAHGSAGNAPAWFELHSKSGQIMEFGHTSDSQVLATGKTTVRSWALDKVADSKGNYLTVTYTQDAANGQAYPATVAYTGNTSAGTSPNNSVSFTYATRPDVLPLYQAGSLLSLNKRLTEIKAYAGTTLVNDYKLAYQQDANNTQTELSSVTQCAGDGTCLPATTFGWSSSSSGNFVLSAGPTRLLPPTYTNFSFSLVDVNGDGKAELVGVESDANGVYYVTATANSDGSFTVTKPETKLLPPSYAGFTPNFADIRGKGVPDIAAIYNGTSGVYYYTAKSNLDGSFSLSQPQSFILPPTYTNYISYPADLNGGGKYGIVSLYNISSGVYYYSMESKGDGSFFLKKGQSLLTPPDFRTFKFYVSDLNGDGISDIIGVYAGANGIVYVTALGNGDGSFTLINPPETLLSSAQTTGFATYLADVNGDGKPDIVGVYNGAYNGGAYGVYYFVALNKGDGTFAMTQAPTALKTVLSGYANSLYVADVNGDGKADIIGVANTRSGGYYFLASSNGDGSFAVKTKPETNFTLSSVAGYYTVFGDIFGNGISSIVGISNTSSGVYYYTLTPPQNRASLTTITTGLGVTTTISYAPLSGSGAPYTKDSGSNAASYPQVDVQGPIYVVSKVISSNGIGSTGSLSYSYTGAKSDLSGRGYLGFRQMTVTDNQTGLVQTSSFSQSFPTVGMVTSRTKVLNGVTLNNVTNSYQSSNLGYGNYFVGTSSTVTASNDLDGTALPTVTTSYQYDAYGNPTQIVIKSADGFTKTTTNSYANDTTHWYLGRLQSSSVTSVSP